MSFNFNPRLIVEELNKYVIGQDEAKKAVAIAVVNRNRRMKVTGKMKDFITPKNVMLVGPTGVGKTEISRYIAHIIDAPFIKTEATKYTEIGYVGKDVESIVRDLVEKTINEQKNKLKKRFTKEAEEIAIEEILHTIITDKTGCDTNNITHEIYDKYLDDYNSGKLDDYEVEIEVKAEQNQQFNTIDIPGMPGAAVGAVSIAEIFSGGKPKKKRKMLVKNAVKALTNDKLSDMIDDDDVIDESLEKVQNEGIIFIDEIDKIAVSSNSKKGEVSREGVQRDLLPLLEGTSVQTKYGMINTDHILFISAGAFHSSKPSDLSPEFQGRFPIRVNLKPLTRGDFLKILKFPEFSLLKQYIALVATENIAIKIDDDAIEEITVFAEKLNFEIENIGARRLHTILEKVFEEVNYTASDLKKGDIFTIDKTYVDNVISGLTKDKKNLKDSIL